MSLRIARRVDRAFLFVLLIFSIFLMQFQLASAAPTSGISGSKGPLITVNGKIVTLSSWTAQNIALFSWPVNDTV